MDQLQTSKEMAKMESTLLTIFQVLLGFVDRSKGTLKTNINCSKRYYLCSNEVEFSISKQFSSLLPTETILWNNCLLTMLLLYIYWHFFVPLYLMVIIVMRLCRINCMKLSIQMYPIFFSSFTSYLQLLKRDRLRG